MGRNHGFMEIPPDKTPNQDEMIVKLERGGVFVAVLANLTSIECIDFITECEIELVKISLVSKKTLYVGSY